MFQKENSIAYNSFTRNLQRAFEVIFFSYFSILYMFGTELDFLDRILIENFNHYTTRWDAFCDNNDLSLHFNWKKMSIYF